MIYPGGLEVDYSYDDESRVVGVTASYTNGTNTFLFGYDSASRPTWIGYPNGIYSSFEYDAESRVVGFSHGMFHEREIIRDARGYKTSEEYVVGLAPIVIEGQQLVENNIADQLVHINQRDTWLGGELNQWYERDFLYNDNGQVHRQFVSRPSWNTNSTIDEYTMSYAWTSRNWLEMIGRQEEGSTQYLFSYFRYDAFGTRAGMGVQHTDGSVDSLTYLVLDYTDGLRRPLAETTSSGVVTRYYIWVGTRLLCHIEANGTVRYYHADELGSTLALTDETGNVTDEFAYMPYGECTARTGSTRTPFQWLGGYGVYYDDVSDVYLTLHRCYDHQLKRFISPDPLGIDGGVNVYMWANLNPLAFIDPYGLCAESFGDRFNSGLNKFSSWLDDNEVARRKEQANYQAQYRDYMTNPKYATVRDYSQATRSVADKVTTAFGVYGAYKTFAVAPKSGTTVFRQGTFADDAVGWKGNYLKGKQWAGKHPLTTPNYAKRYGLPAENTKPHWVTGGKTTGPYTTRPAPPSHNSPINTGGGPEILPKDPNSVRLDWFHMLDD